MFVKMLVKRSTHAKERKKETIRKKRGSKCENINCRR